MLTAKQARDFKNVVKQSSLDVIVAKILQSVAEEVVDSKSKDYVYATISNDEQEIKYVVEKLEYLGYKVEVDKDGEYCQCDLTVRF